jgi:hypothetical protein
MYGVIAEAVKVGILFIEILKKQLKYLINQKLEITSRK